MVFISLPVNSQTHTKYQQKLIKFWQQKKRLLNVANINTKKCNQYTMSNLEIFITYECKSKEQKDLGFFSRF
jgi:hypothetical protein